MYDFKMVDPDYNFENTLNENNVLKSNNRALGIILVVVVALFGVVIANSVVKRLEEETKQRV
jgi:hypothetical protein